MAGAGRPVAPFWSLTRFRRSLRRGDEASAQLVTFIVGTSVFLVSSATLLHFVAEPPGGTEGLDHADLKSRASQALDVLLSTYGYAPGRGHTWAESAEGIEAMTRLGLLERGSSIRVDPAKFEALANGSVWNPSDTNGAIDYNEAKAALGLAGYDFHLRAYPLFDPFSAGSYGVEDMEDFRVAYVGDFAGAVEQPSSELERGYLAELPIAFQNATRATALGVGDAFRDDKDDLRNYLVPNLGGVPVQSVISHGSGSTSHGFRVVDGDLVTTVAPTWLSASSSLALVKEGVTEPAAADFGYTKNRELRAVLGLANMSGMPVTATLAWTEWVDNAGDAGDYGYFEVSPDNGATWYPVTNSPLLRSTGIGAATASRSVSITSTNCAPCLGKNEVWVAMRWVADNDNTIGKGWIVDDVTVTGTATTFRKDFETPAYDLLVIGSNVDQNALTAAEVKNAIRDYVQEHGGRLVVLGGQTNTNWLQPLFHVGVRDANPGISTPDATHPLLTVPNSLDWSAYDHNDKVWEFTANSADDLFSMVVGTSENGHVLSVSDSGAFGDTTADGVVMLTTYLPYDMGEEQGKRFIANVLTYGRYHRLYLEVGPEIPAGASVAAATRTATMDKSRVGESFLEMSFVLYVWKGASSAPTTPGSTDPGAPRNLTATASAGTVTLAWDEPETRADTVTGYRIYRGTMAYTESYLAPEGSRTYVDSGLVNGRTYFYYVTAIGDDGGESDPSARVSATPTTVPTAPQAVVAVGAVNAIVLAWDAPASNGGSAIQTYYVYGGDDQADLAELGSTSETTWQHTGLDAGEHRYYVVHAYNAAGHGANSTAVEANAVGAPTAPLALVAVGGSGEVALSWSAPHSGSPTDYQIYRGGGLGALTLLASTGGANTTFTDRAVVAGETWYYEVRGVNEYGAGAASASAVASTLPTPNAPTALTATGLAGGISLTWTPPTLGAPITGYTLQRSLDGGTWSDLATLGAANVSFLDAGLGNNATRHYMIRAHNAQGAGDLSAPASATTLQPSAPLALTATPGVQSIQLAWTPALDVTGVTHYVVWRSSDGSTFTQLAEVPAANVSFTDATLGNGVTRHYYVRANNSLGEGLPSPTAAATTLMPGAPLLPLASGGVRQASLTWTAPLTTAGLTHYSVWRSTDGTTFTFLASTGGTNTTFVDATLGNAVTVSYQIRANNSAGAGEASTTVNATTAGVPSQPLTLLVTPLVGKQMSLLWGVPSSDGGSAVTHYEVWRKTGSAGTWTRVTNVTAPATSLTDTVPTAGVPYYYRVVAVNAVGAGPASAETHATSLP